MKLNLRKDALRASTAFVAGLLAVADASAHTDSLGFVINPGSTSGVFNVDIFYGSWHPNVPGPEGAVDLTLEDGTPIGTSVFQLYPGFSNVSNGTLPPGLVPGVNYFFPDYMGGLTGDPTGHFIYAFQFATFLDLLPGSYLFGYNAGSSFTIFWDPSDFMINAGAFAIDINGNLIVIGANGSIINLTQSYFTSDQFLSGAATTFDGGVLRIVAGSEALTNDFEVNASGGTIDTNALEAEFAGGFSGDGVVTIVGGGAASVTGDNTHAGFYVDHATLRVDDDSALGAPGATLTLNHGVLNPLGSMSIDRDIVISSSHGGEISVGSGDTLTLNGALSGTGCLYKTGLGVLDLRANAANDIGACVQQGMMAFNSTFTGNVWVDPGAMISGAGQIVGDVEVGGTLSPGNSPGQMIVAGNVTQLPGSTLLIEIDGPTPGNGAGHYDTLVLTGAGSVFTADGTLAPLLRGITAPANNSFTPAIGDLFTIVTAEGGVAGAFDALDQPGAGLAPNTRFDVLYGANVIVLAVTAADYGLALANLGLGNARTAAHALQGVRPDAGATGTGAVGAFFDGLMGMNQAQLAVAFQQTSGDIHATAMAGAHRASRLGRNAVLARLGERETERHVWGEALGAYAKIDEDANANSFDVRSAGLATGADAPIGERLTLGGALAFVEADTRGDGRAQSQSYQALAYARWTHGDIFANAVAAYSVDRYATRRTVALSTGAETLTASPDGATIAFEIEVGRSLTAGPGTLDLIAGASWEQVSRDAVAEDGAAAVALTFDDEDSEAIRLRAGGRYGVEVNGPGGLLRGYAQSFLLHTPDGSRTSLGATLHGANFVSTSADAGDVGLETGLGLIAELGRGASLYAHYRGDFTTDQTQHAAQIGARLAW